MELFSLNKRKHNDNSHFDNHWMSHERYMLLPYKAIFRWLYL